MSRFIVGFRPSNKTAQVLWGLQREIFKTKSSDASIIKPQFFMAKLISVDGFPFSFIFRAYNRLMKFFRTISPIEVGYKSVFLKKGAVWVNVSLDIEIIKGIEEVFKEFYPYEELKIEVFDRFDFPIAFLKTGNNDSLTEIIKRFSEEKFPVYDTFFNLSLYLSDEFNIKHIDEVLTRRM